MGRDLRAADPPGDDEDLPWGAGVFAHYLVDQRASIDVSAITREHVEAFVTDQLPRGRPATAATRRLQLRRALLTQVFIDTGPAG